MIYILKKDFSERTVISHVISFQTKERYATYGTFTLKVSPDYISPLLENGNFIIDSTTGFEGTIESLKISIEELTINGYTLNWKLRNFLILKNFWTTQTHLINIAEGMGGAGTAGKKYEGGIDPTLKHFQVARLNAVPGLLWEIFLNLTFKIGYTDATKAKEEEEVVIGIYNSPTDWLKWKIKEKIKPFQEVHFTGVIRNGGSSSNLTYTGVGGTFLNINRNAVLTLDVTDSTNGDIAHSEDVLWQSQEPMAIILTDYTSTLTANPYGEGVSSLKKVLEPLGFKTADEQARCLAGFDFFEGASVPIQAHAVGITNETLTGLEILPAVCSSTNMANDNIEYAAGSNLTEEKWAYYKGLEIGRPFSEWLEETLTPLDLGYRAKLDLENSKIKFEVYGGDDLTDNTNPKAVVFSPERKNLKNINGGIDTTEYKNVCYVLGEFETGQQVRMELYIDGYEDNRRETLITVSSQGSSGGMEDDDGVSLEGESHETREAYLDRMRTEGEAELARCLNVESFEFEALPADYGKRYKLGDLVYCRMSQFNVEFKVRVEMVEHIIDRTGDRLKISLGMDKFRRIRSI